MKSSKNRGVTLVELLSITGILAVLCALIFPSISAIRSRAQGATCVSNLRQMGTAIASYASDHNGELPINNSANGSTEGMRWYLMLNPYLGKSATSDERGWERPSIFFCPANDLKSTSGKYALWMDVSYWCNLFFMPRWGGENGWSNGKGPVRMMNIPRERILVADNPKGSGANSYMMHFRNEIEANFKKPYPPGQEGDPNGRAYIHGKGINALFADTSVRQLTAIEVNRPGSEIPTGSYFGGLK